MPVPTTGLTAPPEADELAVARTPAPHLNRAVQDLTPVSVAAGVGCTQGVDLDAEDADDQDKLVSRLLGPVVIAPNAP